MSICVDTLTARLLAQIGVLTVDNVADTVQAGVLELRAVSAPMNEKKQAMLAVVAALHRHAVATALRSAGVPASLATSADADAVAVADAVAEAEATAERAAATLADIVERVAPTMIEGSLWLAHGGANRACCVVC